MAVGFLDCDVEVNIYSKCPTISPDGDGMAGPAVKSVKADADTTSLENRTYKKYEDNYYFLGLTGNKLRGSEYLDLSLERLKKAIVVLETIKTANVDLKAGNISPTKWDERVNAALSSIPQPQTERSALFIIQQMLLSVPQLDQRPTQSPDGIFEQVKKRYKYSPEQK